MSDNYDRERAVMLRDLTASYVKEMKEAVAELDDELEGQDPYELDMDKIAFALGTVISASDLARKYYGDLFSLVQSA